MGGATPRNELGGAVSLTSALGLHTSVLLWGLAFIGQALIFSMSVYLFLQCSPTEKYWDHDVPGICLPDSTMIGIEYFVSSYSAFLDFFLAIFPAPFIMRLNMPLKTRLAVTGALGLGVFASIIQGYKLSIMGASFEYTAEDPSCELQALVEKKNHRQKLTPPDRSSAIPQHVRGLRGMHSPHRRLVAGARTTDPHGKRPH